MSEFKGTTGNWFCTTDGRYPIQIESDHKQWKDSDFTRICDVGLYDTGSLSFEESFANARLLSAAPDLLAACIKVRDYMRKMELDWLGNGDDPLDAAIAKALGETQ